MDMTKSERAMKWQKANPERYKALSKASRDRIIHNPARLKRRREKFREYYAANRKLVIASHRKWREQNPWAMIADSCRSSIRNVIYGISCRGPKTEALIGCTCFEFRDWIEKQFEPGMTWENFGRGGWTLGHKKAVREFKDVLETETGRQACFHYTNLQPEWERNNRAKHTRDGLTPAQVELNS